MTTLWRLRAMKVDSAHWRNSGIKLKRRRTAIPLDDVSTYP